MGPTWLAPSLIAAAIAASALIGCVDDTPAADPLPTVETDVMPTPDAGSPPDLSSGADACPEEATCQSDPAPIEIMRDQEGDWALALPPALASSYRIEVGDAATRIGSFEDPSGALAGAITSASRPVGDDEALLARAAAILDARLPAELGVEEVVHSGPFVTHDGLRAAPLRAVLRASVATTPAWVRDQLVLADDAALTSPPAGDVREFVARVTVVWPLEASGTARERQIVTVAAGAPEATPADLADYVHHFHTHHLGRADATLEPSCHRLDVRREYGLNDLLLAVDTSSSMGAFRDEIARWIDAVFEVAATNDIRLRIGLVDMDPAGAPLPRGGWHTDAASARAALDVLFGDATGAASDGLVSVPRSLAALAALPPDHAVALRPEAERVVVLAATRPPATLLEHPAGTPAGDDAIEAFLAATQSSSRVGGILDVHCGDGAGYEAFITAVEPLCDNGGTPNPDIGLVRPAAGGEPILPTMPVAASLRVVLDGRELTPGEDGFRYDAANNQVWLSPEANPLVMPDHAPCSGRAVVHAQVLGPS